jgi:hypothetical protein
LNIFLTFPFSFSPRRPARSVSLCTVCRVADDAVRRRPLDGQAIKRIRIESIASFQVCSADRRPVPLCEAHYSSAHPSFAVSSLSYTGPIRYMPKQPLRPSTTGSASREGSILRQSKPASPARIHIARQSDLTACVSRNTKPLSRGHPGSGTTYRRNHESKQQQAQPSRILKTRATPPCVLGRFPNGLFMSAAIPRNTINSK